MNITKNHLWFILIFALLLRLVSLATYPLMDTTEARYGEMARLMVETGNWLTPQFDYDVPFWGKPPLFTWMSAIGIEIFGLSEFAVRAPHWLAGLLTILLMAYMAKRENSSALISSIVLATCGIFAIAAGAVMTDMALTLTSTVTMVGFYFAWKQQDGSGKAWGYLAFVGMAAGMLAKGPIAIVLTGLAVMPWMIYQHGFIGAFVELWRRFPIIGGTALMLAIALPWYIMAEAATPGFIDYFIVGEHFKRFLVSGWEGDLYGSAHDEPRGMIWLFWLQSALPWSIVLPVLAWKRRSQWQEKSHDKKALMTFLLCWLLAPMVLFTMAGNILPAYVLPGIPALGLLIALYVQEKDYKWISSVAAVVPVLLLIAMLVLNLGKADSRSDRVIHQAVTIDAPVYYVGHRPFSGQFYSYGQAVRLDSSIDLKALSGFYLIGKNNQLQSKMSSDRLSCVHRITAESNRSLYYCENNNNG